MLAREMLKVYVPAAERRKLYAEKVPGIMARLKASELIAKNLGLINESSNAVTPGRLMREYRRNLAVIELISHVLFRLEFDRWLKVYPDRVYYVEEKKIPLIGCVERHRIFDVIMETVAEVGRTVYKDFNVARAGRIFEACKYGGENHLPPDIEKQVLELKGIFRKVEDLQEARKIESERKKGFFSGISIAPLKEGMAKDIAASGHFAVENRKVFNSSATKFVIRTADRSVLAKRMMEAYKFEQQLTTEIERARKELSASDLRKEFSLGPADRTTLFPKEADAFLTQVSKAFSPSDNDNLKYLELLSDRLHISGKELVHAQKFLLDVFLPNVRQRFVKAVAEAEKVGASFDVKEELLGTAKVGIADILLQFVGDKAAEDISLRLGAVDPKTARRLDASIKGAIIRIADRHFGEILKQAKKSVSDLNQYKMVFMISDPHFQDYPHRDTIEILRLIHVVAASGGTLVINGDVIDTWRAGMADKIYASNKIIFDAMRKIKRVIIIKGNHDGWAEDLIGQKIFSDNVSVVERFWDDSIHIEHGHSFDRYNSEGSRVGRTATRLVNVLERNEEIGPQLLSWIEYAGKRVLPNETWKAQKVDRVVKGIKEALRRRDPDGTIYSQEKPLNIVFGHYHFPGLFNAYDEINKRIEKELGGRVRFFLTDSWYNSQGYAGQVLVFAKKKEGGTGQLLISRRLLEYIGANEILTLYGNWLF